MVQENTQSKYNSKKANTATQHYSGLVTCYDARPGNDMGLFYSAPEPTWGQRLQRSIGEFSVTNSMNIH